YYSAFSAVSVCTHTLTRRAKRGKKQYFSAAFCFFSFIFKQLGPVHTPWGPPPARAGGVGVAVAKRLFEERICQVHVSQMSFNGAPETRGSIRFSPQLSG